MKRLATIFIATLSLSGFALGDEPSEPRASIASPHEKKAQFLVTLSEYQLEKAIPVKATEAEILESVRSSGVVPIETLRMTAMANSEAMVQFGRRATITVTQAAQGRYPPMKKTESIDIGTVLKVMVVPSANDAMVEIDYSTARLAENGDETSPADVITNTIQSTQHYPFGKDRLVSATSYEDAPCIIVTVQKLP